MPSVLHPLLHCALLYYAHVDREIVTVSSVYFEKDNEFDNLKRGRLETKKGLENYLFDRSFVLQFVSNYSIFNTL